jgi:hypothetical protein
MHSGSNTMVLRKNISMTTSTQIAGLLGPTLIAVSVSEAINFRSLTAYAGPALVPVIYLNGTLLFIAGLAIVRTHNRWNGGWAVLVTLIGWLAMLAGLARMIAPVSAQRAGENTIAIFGVLIVLLIAGIFLSLKAYGPQKVKIV